MINKKYIFLLIFLFIILLLLYHHFFVNIENYENFTSSNIGIPKIIHQTAPADKSKWKEDWHTCQKTWFEYFPEPEYTYKMWNDDDLENLIMNDFAWYYDIYKSYKKNIQRFDIARYFILYKYGGIYADMDYMCMKNFYDLLPQDKVSISESPFTGSEYFQNALMISNANNDFFLKVIEEAKNRKNSEDVLYSTGPVLVSDVYFKNKDMVNPLSIDLYNPSTKEPEKFNHPHVITKHLCTNSWN